MSVSWTDAYIVRTWYEDGEQKAERGDLERERLVRIVNRTSHRTSQQRTKKNKKRICEFLKKRKIWKIINPQIFIKSFCLLFQTSTSTYGKDSEHRNGDQIRKQTWFSSQFDDLLNEDQGDQKLYYDRNQDDPGDRVELCVRWNMTRTGMSRNVPECVRWVWRGSEGNDWKWLEIN